MSFFSTALATLKRSRIGQVGLPHRSFLPLQIAQSFELKIGGVLIECW